MYQTLLQFFGSLYIHLTKPTFVTGTIPQGQGWTAHCWVVGISPTSSVCSWDSSWPWLSLGDASQGGQHCYRVCILSPSVRYQDPWLILDWSLTTSTLPCLNTNTSNQSLTPPTQLHPSLSFQVFLHFISCTSFPISLYHFSSLAFHFWSYYPTLVLLHSASNLITLL